MDLNAEESQLEAELQLQNERLNALRSSKQQLKLVSSCLAWSEVPVGQCLPSTLLITGTAVLCHLQASDCPPIDQQSRIPHWTASARTTRDSDDVLRQSDPGSSDHDHDLPGPTYVSLVKEVIAASGTGIQDALALNKTSSAKVAKKTTWKTRYAHTGPHQRAPPERKPNSSEP